MTKKEIEHVDLVAAAWHEAGHVTVARHFGLQANAVIFKVGPASMDNKVYIGKAFYQRGTLFQKAVIGWAGIAAERFHADGYCNEIEIFDCAEFDEQSATDHEAMFCHPQRWRACKTACSIITRRAKELKQLVNELIQNAHH